MHRFALGNLLSRPVRSVLSMLGLAVAIGGMVGLFSVAGGIANLVEGTFAMIPGVLVQQQGAPIPIFSTLPAAWGDEIAGMEGVSVVNPEILTRVNVIEGKPVLSPPRFLLGFDIPSRMRMRSTVFGECLVAGRFLAVEDEQTLNCLVSRRIAETANRGVGDALRVNGHSLTIVGIYECGSMMLDCNVLVDIGTLRRLSRYDPDSVSCFYVETTAGADQRSIARRIEEHFRGREFEQASTPSLLGDGTPLDSLVQSLVRQMATPPRAEAEFPSPASGAPDGGGDSAAGTLDAALPVEVRSADDWAERFEEFTGDLKLFLTIITGVGITIAVLSIVNTMLMSVTERTIEFGILRANGWTRRNVMSLVTWESAVLGVTGGIVGAAGGWVAVQILNATWPDRLHLHANGGLLASAVVLSTLLGILGGAYPSWRAARMSPMDAIRRG
ncbi:MAG: ABC transporter permease [Planctomyces sp.]|nr:ABC transporter permease [Planctomyces sp.]